MRMRVSTNRSGWQLHGKSSVNAEPQRDFSRKGPLRLGFEPLRA